MSQDADAVNGDADDAIYFEDVEPGTVIDCGSTTVTESEVIEFAERFDPLPMHTDPDAAAEGRFGGLVASGYHTLSLSVRLLVEAVRRDRAVIAGLGIDDVRWHAPVRPGDEIGVVDEVLDTRPSESDPETGIIHESITVTNDADETVLTLENHELIERRERRDGRTERGDGSTESV
ncbi:MULTISPECIES: MaoC family dehydratase [Haloferacaceae]|uniref:MaoC family dehydratase n=1 Tax=Halorubrum glutamatedens TaxID=2707018 RepID=A0ABD5QUZ9_9EURY|nr:MaoC family dehydratase [Halobellus captivus]